MERTFDFWEKPQMLRTIFSIGLFAVLGLIALKFIFGIFGFAVGLFMWLLFIAIKVAVVGLIIYFIIRIVSPDTARRLRERWSGPAM
jgi:predicted membrane metal-binding protein